MKNGNIYIKHKLIESVRTENGPRQRIVMGLGTLKIPKNKWKQLAMILEIKLSGQTTVLNYDKKIESIALELVEKNKLVKTIEQQEENKQNQQELMVIDINSCATIKSRSLGPEIVANHAWNKLDFDNILTECNFDLKQKAVAKAVIIGRLINPASDLETYNWFQNRSSLEEFLNTDITKVSKNNFYEIADELYANKEKLESILVEKEGIIFNRPNNTIFLYDLTNTYFEGAAKNNKLAEFGKCKSKRYDCKLVTLALVVDDKGFPIISQIYSGNQSEPKTFCDIINKLNTDLNRDQISLINPTIVMDRGIATEENIELLRDKNYDYIVIERKDVSNTYIDTFKNAKEEFENIKSSKSCYGETNDVYVKKVHYSDNISHVLCLSEGKEKKEIAIDQKKESRFLEDFEKLKKSILKGSIKKNEVIHKRIGRLKERHPRVSRLYLFETEYGDKGNINNLILGKKITNNQEEKTYGCYVIETSHTQLPAREIWNLYMTLTTVENSFRALKSQLGMRPIFHQNEERTKGHLFISVLAYHLLNTIENELRKNDCTKSWSTIYKELSTHQRNTLVMSSENGDVYHLRLSGNPEIQHLKIYEHIGAKNPLKRINKIAKYGL